MGRKFTLKCHIVFCVKYRKKLLSRPCIASTVKNIILENQTKDFTVQVMEVVKDHIHLLIDYSPDVSVAQIVRSLKQITNLAVWRSHQT